MALVATDGFDMYAGTSTSVGAGTKWAITGASVTMQAGRFGGQAMQVATDNSTDNSARRSLTAARSAGAFGFSFISGGLTDANSLSWISLMSGGGTTYSTGLRFRANGAIEVYLFTSATTGTLLGTTSAGVIPSNTWCGLGWEFTINASTGTVNLYVNGSQVLALTGKNTGSAAVDTFRAERFTPAFAGGAGSFIIDDWYECDTNTWLGEARVQTLRATADSSVTWTPNSGVTNFSRVNETLVDGNTSYVETGTLNNQDLYTYGSLSTAGTVFGVQAVNFAEKTDASTRDIALTVKSGATTSVGGNFALAGGYGRFERMLTTDPNTGSAWAVAAVNAVESGPKVTV